MKDQIVKLNNLIAPAFIEVHNAIKNNKMREYWLKGGRGSCKSSFVSIEIILGLLKDCDAHAIIYRKVADTLRDSVYSQMVWAIEKLQVAHLWQCKLSPMELIYLPTGQRVYFRGADDPQKSKGIKVSKGYFKFLWFEELTEFSGINDIRTIKASVIRGGNAITFYTYNPPMTAINWVNEQALLKVKGRMIHSSNYLQVPKAWLGTSFISEAGILKNTNEKAYLHMYLGEITGTGGSVFENVSLREIKDSEIKNFGTFYEGLDFGYYPDPTHWVRLSYDANSTLLYVIDELRSYKTSDRSFAQALIEKRKQLKLETQTEIIADSANEKSIADIRHEGLWIIAATKGPGSIEMGIKWLITRKNIVIDPNRTPYTAKEFQQYEYVRNKQGEFVQGYEDKNNHAIDSVRYALNRIWLRRDC